MKSETILVDTQGPVTRGTYYLYVERLTWSRG
jgi:hypothetical protein